MNTNPPAVTDVEITEPTAVHEGIELIDQHAVQLQPEPLRARRVIVRLDGAAVWPRPTARTVYAQSRPTRT